MELRPPVSFHYSHEGTMVTDHPGVSYRDLLNLIGEAEASPLRRARINTHQSDDAALHQMIICMCAGSPLPIHRHRKDETFMALKGEVFVTFYDDSGEPSDRFILKPYEIFCLRIPAGQWHAMEVMRDHAMFIETTTGPWRKEEMEVWQAS